VLVGGSNGLSHCSLYRSAGQTGLNPRYWCSRALHLGLSAAVMSALVSIARRLPRHVCITPNHRQNHSYTGASRLKRSFCSISK